MDQKIFEHILKLWKNREEQEQQALVFSKTGSCISFEQFDAADFSIEQQEHIQQCNYCSRMNRLFDKYRRQQDAVLIAVDEKEARVQQESLWEKLKENLNGFIHGLGNFVAPIPSPIRLGIPIMIIALILIFVLRTPEAKYATLARIEPLYYQPIESRGEASLSETEKLFQQGMAFYQQGNYQCAINKLLLVSKSQPDEVNANFYVGLCYLLTKKADRAILHLQKVIELNGEFLFEKCYWYLGNAYLLKEDGKKALEMFEKVVAMEGDFEWEARGMIEKISKIE